MQATSSTYLKEKIGTRLFAASLALAGSGTMLGGSLGIAEYYAVTAPSAPSVLARQADAPQKLVRNSCPDRAS
jgi:hypothetical protein